MEKRLEGKVCIITGSGAGIGKAIAKRFAEEGAEVICSSRRAVNGQPVCDEILRAGGKAAFVPCDVSKEEEVTALFDFAIRKYGRVDVLVNNAGVNYDKPFDRSEIEDWDRVINVDLRGTFLCTHRCIHEMLKTGGGSIINITSVHTLACMPGATPYDAAKWGVVGMTKSLAVEFSSRGIRVNALSPGLIATDIWEDIQNAAPSREACYDYWKSNIPMGRAGDPEEVASAAVFLASDEASFFSGSNILIDGGQSSQLVSTPPYQSAPIEGKKR